MFETERNRRKIQFAESGGAADRDLVQKVNGELFVAGITLSFHFLLLQTRALKMSPFGGPHREFSEISALVGVVP